jgi:hypothetical protein
MTLDNCPNIACTQPFLRDITQQYHDLIACKVCYTYLAGLGRIEGNQLRNIRAVVDLLSLTSWRA